MMHLNHSWSPTLYAYSISSDTAMIWRTTLLCLSFLIISQQIQQSGEMSYAPKSDYGTESARIWVDSVYDHMTMDERIGQLMMVRAHSDKGAEHIASVEKLITDYHVGSLCFFQGTPDEQLHLTNRYQDLASIPLLIAMDAEWGLGMRMKESTMSFPRQMMLGAIRDNAHIYDVGHEIGRQLRRIGVHMNFAPVVDVNNNAANPVIGTRSFGEDPYAVSDKSIAYMNGLHAAGIIACGKHFPGHGDTDVDSHYDLPIVAHNRRRLDSIELVPFRHLIHAGVDAIMIAHLSMPALDSAVDRPTTLSKDVVTDLLQGQLQFGGLVVTDAMEMKGVTKHYPPGVAEAEAFLAGNDIICLPRSVPSAVSVIRSYIDEGKISTDRLARSVKKILLTKYRAVLHQTRQDTVGLYSDLHNVQAQSIKRQAIHSALTLVRNDYDLVPVIDPSRLLIWSIGTSEQTSFERTMRQQGCMDIHMGSSLSSNEKLNQLAKDKQAVVVAFHQMNNSASQAYGIDQTYLRWLKDLNQKIPVVPILFGNPYALEYFDDFGTVIVAYENDDLTKQFTAEALVGAYTFDGQLPVSASDLSRVGSGVHSRSLFRTVTALPEEVGVSSHKLQTGLDTLLDHMVQDKVTPGGQVLVIKNNRIIYDKSFGYHTYDEKRQVHQDDIYDLASITKVLATTLSIMDLYDRGLINIFMPIDTYLPELKGSNKEGMIIEDILIHKAGLKAWIPFYKETLAKNHKPDPKWYSEKAVDPYTVQVTDKLYLHQDYLDSIWQKIIDSDVTPKPTYRYSDLGFYLLDRIIERVSGMTVDAYVSSRIYKPLQLSHIGFRPSSWYPMDKIVPTEEDRYFRYCRIQGYVHDMGAAMRGGVSGHAGLFADSHDVGILMQMLLNGGYYGGRRLLHPFTVALFTARPDNELRRGLGFDMKQLDPKIEVNMANSASYRTFGHLGFTGTCVWADPMYQIVFVFLSNRTYPDMNENKLHKENYRPRLQEIIYQSLN